MFRLLVPESNEQPCKFDLDSLESTSKNNAAETAGGTG
jgi:hypothetical protein